jgi:hypothetical protein
MGIDRSQGEWGEGGQFPGMYTVHGNIDTDLVAFAWEATRMVEEDGQGT